MTHTKTRTEVLHEQGAALAGKVGTAVDWAQPRLEKGWAQSKEAAAPRVEAAVQKVTPAVDGAHRAVEDLLPKIVEAVQEAASNAKESAGPALTSATAAVTTAAGTVKAAQKSAKTAGKGARKTAKKAAKTARKHPAATLAAVTGAAAKKKQQKKSGAGKKLLVLTILAAGGAAVWAATRGQKEDPWAAPGAAWTPAPSATTPTTPATAASTEKLEQATGTGRTSGETSYAVTDDEAPHAAPVPLSDPAAAAAADADPIVQNSTLGGATADDTSVEKPTDDTEGGRKA